MDETHTLQTLRLLDADSCKRGEDDITLYRVQTRMGSQSKGMVDDSIL